MTKTLVYFRHGELERPVLTVMDQADQVVIAIRTEANEHLTLHRAEDGVIVTLYSPEMASSVHDKDRVSAARAAGYRDPARHGEYVMHQYLWAHVIGMDGHELCGRRIYLDRATVKRKHARLPRIVIDTPTTEFMLRFILATAEQPYSAADDPHISTSFGDLYFRPEPG
jgi:hypothetical protein